MLFRSLLPAKLADSYEQARSDMELLSLRDDIALLDSRLADVIGQGGLETVLSRLGALQIRLRSETIQGENEVLKDISFELEALISEGGEEIDSWGEIYRLLNQRCRLVESERKRLVELQQYISAEKVMVLLSVVLETIQKHVSDASALTAISADFRELVAV